MTQNPWAEATAAMENLARTFEPIVEDAKAELRSKGIDPDHYPDYPVLDQLADLEAGRWGKL